MEDLISGIEHLKQAMAHISKANGLMSDHISKLKALEEENAALKDELSAMQIQPDSSYMKLPLDADGKPIHIGDEMDVSRNAILEARFASDGIRGAAMKRRNWAVCIWLALMVFEAIAMLAALIAGQDPYRHQVLAMLALLLVLANEIEERL